jgi:hypothetical protein
MSIVLLKNKVKSEKKKLQKKWLITNLIKIEFSKFEEALFLVLVVQIHSIKCFICEKKKTLV